jgi:uncharacterized protein
MSGKQFETRRVEFEVDGSRVVGILHIPESSSGAPALVFEGPLTSVKEQVTGNYAQAMARRGYVSLAFDHRYFGESGGEPRQYESPAKKVEDLRGAIDFLGGQPEVDPRRIGGVGICAGGGYMARAVADDPRMRAFGAVAGFFHDVEQQKQWMGDEKWNEALEEAAEARRVWEAEGEVRTIPAVGTEGRVAMPLDDAREYYSERGNVPNYTNAFALLSRADTLPFDAQSAAPQIRVPTLVVHSENALAPGLARKFIEGLAGPKHDVWLESRAQTDFYDDPTMVSAAADRLAAHFAEHLR